MDEKVKGVMLLPYQELILANKSLNWDQFLKNEDWDIIQSRILNLWYPFGTFERCGLAAFNLIAKKNLKAVRIWAKQSATQIFHIYKMIVEAGNPISGISNMLGIRTILFNFNLFDAEIEKIDGQHIKTVSVSKKKIAEGIEAFNYQLIGWFEYIIEQNNGKNPKIEILAKQWAGEPKTILDITWK